MENKASIIRKVRLSSFKRCRYHFLIHYIQNFAVIFFFFRNLMMWFTDEVSSFHLFISKCLRRHFFDPTDRYCRETLITETYCAENKCPDDDHCADKS